MHAALTLPELLLHVLDHVGSQTDLLNAALVCQSWKAWALDSRWRCCRISLRALLRTLGPVKEAPCDRAGPSVFIVDVTPDDVSEERWNAFLKRTQQARHVSLNRFALHRSSIDLIHSLSDTYGERPLFPLLRSVTMTMNSNMADTAILLVSPSLRSVSIENTPHSSHQSMNTVMKALASTAPSIHHLRFCSHWGDPSSQIPCFADLRSLDCSNASLDYNAWEFLATCPSLTQLHVYELRLEDDPRLLDGEPLVFDALTHLRISQTNSRTHTIQVLSKSHMPALQSLVLFRLYLPSDEVQQLACHWSRTSPLIDELKVICQTIDFKAIKACLGLRRLRTLEIGSEREIAICDRGFAPLTKLMGKLETLALTWPISHRPDSKYLTASSLISLARHATSLKNLTIIINADCFDSNTSSEHQPFAQLQTLFLEDLRVRANNISAFSTMLASLCPAVSHMEASQYYACGRKCIMHSEWKRQLHDTFWASRAS
ncbi:hypothetical protein FRB99_000159 [Tulasnella sp. 403]|nr:hypothetical protein FRB99_000159 [Tulasnella sp. 403]